MANNGSNHAALAGGIGSIGNVGPTVYPGRQSVQPAYAAQFPNLGVAIVSLKEQLERGIADRKSQITVLEHLLATINLGAFKDDEAAGAFFDRVVYEALSQASKPRAP